MIRIFPLGVVLQVVRWQLVLRAHEFVSSFSLKTGEAPAQGVAGAGNVKRKGEEIKVIRPFHEKLFGVC